MYLTLSFYREVLPFQAILEGKSLKSVPSFTASKYQEASDLGFTYETGFDYTTNKDNYWCKVSQNITVNLFLQTQANETNIVQLHTLVKYVTEI